MDVGAFVLVTLLGAGAAYGLANRDKPKPALSSGRSVLQPSVLALRSRVSCLRWGSDCCRTPTPLTDEIKGRGPREMREVGGFISPAA